MKEIMVSIICNTYNHENYIRDAIESFLMQKTSFCYEILVHDDASSDGTVNIIKEYENKYPEMIFPIYQIENQYSKGIAIEKEIQLPRARGRYIALCEGDDFWTDKNKLQKQVDYLESHHDTSMVCHAGYFVDESGYKLPGLFKTYSDSRILTASDVIRKWVCPTGSIVYRKDSYLENCFPKLTDAPCGDYPMIINMSLYGKIYYSNEVMSAYRISTSSVSSGWRNNTEKEIKKDEKFIGMLNQIDKLTEYRYAEDIDNMRARREYEILLLEGRFSEAKKDRYCEFYRENRKSYYYQLIKHFFPIVQKLRVLFDNTRIKNTCRTKLNVF